MSEEGNPPAFLHWEAGFVVSGIDCHPVHENALVAILEGKAGHLLDLVVIDHHRGRDQGDDLVLDLDLVIVVTAPRWQGDALTSRRRSGTLPSMAASKARTVKSGNQPVTKQGAFLARFPAFRRALSELGISAQSERKALHYSKLRDIFGTV